MVNITKTNDDIVVYVGKSTSRGDYECGSTINLTINELMSIFIRIIPSEYENIARNSIILKEKAKRDVDNYNKSRNICCQYSRNFLMKELEPEIQAEKVKHQEIVRQQESARQQEVLRQQSLRQKRELEQKQNLENLNKIITTEESQRANILSELDLAVQELLEKFSAENFFDIEGESHKESNTATLTKFK